MEPALTFSNRFWGKDDAGYHRLIQRMHQSKQTCEELTSYYRERMNIEQEYSRKLSALAKKPLGQNETGSLRLSLDTVRATTETMSRSHEATARQIAEQLNAPLEKVSASLRDRRKTIEDNMAQLTKAKEAHNATAKKARARYETECHKITGHQAQQNLLMGQQLEKNNQKLDKAKFNVEGLEAQYRGALKVLAQSIDQWNREWKDSCDRLQELEEERIKFFKSNLWAYANAVSTVCVNDDECCERIRVALERCEAEKDIEHYAQQFGTGSQMQDAPEFTNFLGRFSREDDGHYKVANFSSTKIPDLQPYANSSQASSPAMSSPTMSVYSSEGTSVSSNSPRTEKRRSWAMPFKRQSSPDLHLNHPSRSSVSAEPNHVPTSSSAGLLRTQIQPELAPRPVSYAPTTETSSDDPLLAALEQLKTSSAPKKPRPQSMPQMAPQPTIQPQQPRNQYVNPYNNGMVTSPSNDSMKRVQREARPTRKEVSSPSQRASSQPRLPQRTSDGRRVLKHSRALYDYRAAIPEEVSFRKGDILLITYLQEDGWWDSEVLGAQRFGLAPSNFLADV